MQRQDSTNSFLEWLSLNLTSSNNFDELLAQEIVDRLGNSPKIPYSEMANVAFHSGQKNLALKILEHEFDDSLKVEKLLEWSENTAAFIKALESGNPDLIYMAMLKLCENMPFEDFKTTIRNFPIAVTLYKKYCTQYDLENLQEILSQENDHKGQACTFIKEAIDKNKSHMRDSLLTSAVSAFKKARQNFHSQLCEEQLKLLEFQKQINNENSDVNYIGRTVNETCLLLLKNEQKMAEDFRNEFKIPDRRFYWLKIRTLAELGEWTELERVSRMKKCPLGYEKFIDVCLERNNKEEAKKYLEKVGEKFKIKYYIKMGCFEEAVQTAYKRRDRQSLLLARSCVKSKSELAKKVDSLVSSLDTATCQIWHSFTI